MGSLSTTMISTRPQCWHSKRWWLASNFDSSMRSCRQFGQRGRSTAQMSDDDTGWYSGMHAPRDDLATLQPRIALPAVHAEVKAAQVADMNEQGERIDAGGATLQFKLLVNWQSANAAGQTPLPPDARAPRAHEFRRPVLDPHGKFPSHGFRRFSRGAFHHARGTRFRRRG